MLRFAAAAALALPIAAQDVFVDAVRGNDANPGTATRPVRSISRGVALVGPGAEVLIYPGTYGPTATGEALPIGLGTAGPHAGVTVRGLGAVVLDLAGSTSLAVQIGPSAAGARITAITFRNSDRQGWWTQTINTMGSATGVEIDRCIFDGVNRGIVLWDAANPDVSGFAIHDNLFVNLGNDAINEFEQQGPNDIFNNTVVGTAAGPNYVGILSDAQGSRIANNLIVGMRDGFARGQSSGNLQFTANDPWACVNPWSGSFNGQAPPGNWALDPRFSAPGLGDYRLSPSSPLLDAGSAAVPYRADLDGEPGAVDGNLDGSVLPDVGAYEIPVARLRVTQDRSTGAVSLALGGPPTVIAAVLFAGGEGLLPLGGYGPLLLDPSRLYPVTTPALALPATVNGTLWQPPGVRIWMQAIGLDPARNALVPGTQQVFFW